MTKKQLYMYIFFSISSIPLEGRLTNKNLKKSLSVILVNLIFFYTKHLLIKQNKKHRKHLHSIPGIKALLVGLWATSQTFSLKKTSRFIKYLYMYYLHSVTFIVRYYV